MPPPSDDDRFPVSALFHEHTKLTDRKWAVFQERIEAADLGAAPRKLYPTQAKVRLDHARRPLLGPRLDDALRTRRSQRTPFRDAPIPKRTLGTLLDLALGKSADGLRAWPSAGALYPLETYVVALACAGVPPALYHYDPVAHELASLAPLPARAELERLVFADGPEGNRWEHAAAAIVFTGAFGRTQAKYGERGYRFVLLEAGHAAQNVLLVATALELAAVPLGGFCEDALGALFALEATAESPIHVVLVGALT